MFTRKLRFAVLSLPVALSGALWGSIAHAAVTITVNTTSDNTTDNGSCSLREAVYSANNLASLNGDCPAGSSTGTIIQLGSHTYTTTTTIDLYQPVTIRGSGVGSTIIRGNLAAGTEAFVSVLYPSGEVAFERLTIDGGTLGGDTTGIRGYGDASLRLQEAAVRDFTDGGIKAVGMPLTLDRSSVFNNSATANGGGVECTTLWGGLGGLRLIQSAIHDNDALGYGGGIAFTAGSNNQWNDSTISSNTAGTTGGGVYIETPAGGSYVQMNRLTIANNDAYIGGGFYEASDSLGSFFVYDTIVGDNTADTAEKDGYGTLSGASYSLFEVTTGISYLDGVALILGVDPQLDPLQLLSSTTKVHPLRFASPAKNVKSWSASAVDQRGLPRGVGFGANKFDIGAFERQ